MSTEKPTKKILIVGGGLVGSLDAVYFANNGYSVEVFESRPDPRKAEIVAGRSINLALSTRGRSALGRVGIEDDVVSEGIPMYARMIHNHDGSCFELPYGRKDQYILSVDRRKLNECLITVAEEKSNAKFHFNSKLLSADLDQASLTFQRLNGENATVHGDLIVGCDGAFSTIRKTMMRKIRLNYEQEYIPHGYKEICLPPRNGEFAIPPNYLHIWPRNTFMMIALPNQDKSFTCTLFAPIELYDEINSDDDVMAFFEREFPDSIPLIGKQDTSLNGHVNAAILSQRNRSQLLHDYSVNPIGDLISVKCYPYHYKDRCVIKGDAAHAMVPFYGQGMNCGFEDCLVFDEILKSCNMDLDETLKKFSDYRSVDAQSMCDLAMYNYIEMRSHVNSRVFLVKRKVDRLLHYLFPSTWIPLYTMVTFSRRRYHDVIARSKYQDKVLTYCAYGSILGMSFVGYRLLLRNSNVSLSSLATSIRNSASDWLKQSTLFYSSLHL